MKWILDIEWMDGETFTIDNIGQYGPGCIDRGAFFCYTKENHYADAKLEVIIPLMNVRQLTVTEANW